MCIKLDFKKIFNVWIILLNELQSAEVEGYESFVFLKKVCRVGWIIYLFILVMTF
jgi:hypothetical protein